jgi:tricarballylate dehydrogenase
MTGKKIGDQPEAKAFQIFDQQTLNLLPKRYETATPIYGDDIDQLADAIGVSPLELNRTISDFNKACPSNANFDPHRLDNLHTASSLLIPKSNWALKMEKGPFVAYAVTCGITFTYGGIQTDTNARVLNNEGRHMPGLWAVGEIAGGLFYHNYPGGAGLTKGAVFGRIAGREAALSRLSTRSRL